MMRGVRYFVMLLSSAALVVEPRMKIHFAYVVLYSSPSRFVLQNENV
jgi:hypothetical protein